MARFLLLVCLWAVVLPAVIEKCHAEDQRGTKPCLNQCEKGKTCDENSGSCICKPPKGMEGDTCKVCPRDKVNQCAETGQTCDEKNGNCTCESPKGMDGGTCKVCPRAKVNECAETGQTCDEKTGNCTCEPPKGMDGDTCKVCPRDKVNECAKTGQTCDEKTGNCTCERPKGMDGDTCKVCHEEKVKECAGIGGTCDEQTGTCTCEEPKKMDDGTCKVCHEEKVKECAGIGGTCDEQTRNCTCEEPKKMDNGTCKDLCEPKLDECKNGKKTSCKVINGMATCVCPPSMKENNGDCFVANKVTVKFKLKSRKKRSITYSVDEECSENKTVLIQTIKENVPNAIEESIVCIGDDVTFDVFAENEKEKEATEQIFRGCMQSDCKLGLSIEIAAKSTKVDAKDMCNEEETKKLAEQMGMTCKFNSTTVMLCNKEKTTAIGTANVQGIPFEICKALPCHQTCKNENMSCVQESCVCKPQYKFEDGKCKSVCHLKTSVCPAGATCVLGEGDQSFYCECPPKLTGPLCTRENKPLQTAKLNIVVVGVVLASLLLLCFVVSASIISRLRKKVQGPSFSKDCERRPQRELRGYDGPYKASDPASLHRGRDHTSL